MISTFIIIYTYIQTCKRPKQHQIDFFETKLSEKLANIKLLNKINIIKGKENLHYVRRGKTHTNVFQPAPRQGITCFKTYQRVKLIFIKI